MLTAVAHASLSDPGFQFPNVGFDQSLGTEPDSDKKIGDKKMKGRGRVKESGTAADPASSFFCQPSFCQNLPPSSFFESLPRPLVVDPFCGGGSIPLEALAEAAS